jgi:hypothetical protein
VRIRLTIFLALLASVLMMGGPLAAHHGGAIYDTKNPVTLKGVVTDFEWTNPHVQIYFDVKDDKGTLVHWACETLSPGKLARGAGWTKDSLKVGDQVTITLNPAKVGSAVGNLRKVVLADGKVLTPQELAPEDQ